MTVAQLVGLFESIDRRAKADVVPRQLRTIYPPSSHQAFTESNSNNLDSVVAMSARKMKLSLHTMFHHQDRSSSSSASSRSRSRSARRSSRTPTASTSAVRPSMGPSPTPAYPFLNRPHTPTNTTPGSTSPSGMLSPASANTSPASSLSSRHHYSHHPYMRRQPSAVDLALEAERDAVGVENIGLGLLEPRPRTRAASGGAVSPSSSAYGMCSLMEVLGESRRAGSVEMEVGVLDGIFEVLERGS
ncbi:uncharacterized protein HMPREF1541_00986 [Cyphellophora europaea CBS 101466]|uniref:Uncharacterized protein n=1 Tax=Cyphellophora europaea (strain CBS 101466) TaxID=1220924 RepID=W2SDM4_CYPE1|nr:uncharacterized protein HMPREF1541_00986 [Cyphellophora europaea CBS 101466]ETN46797.1 hypothetical protein HMPREF1541_00986 [Cyphellophora europaea CBS 101466]